jgi:hypothetical protein
LCWAASNSLSSHCFFFLPLGMTTQLHHELNLWICQKERERLPEYLKQEVKTFKRIHSFQNPCKYGDPRQLLWWTSSHLIPIPWVKINNSFFFFFFGGRFESTHKIVIVSAFIN